MHILQQRDSEYAIESVDADLPISPVVHGSPAEPLSILESAEDSLDGLLAGVSGRYLFRRPVHATGEQNRAAETMRQQALPGQRHHFAAFLLQRRHVPGDLRRGL